MIVRTGFMVRTMKMIEMIARVEPSRIWIEPNPKVSLTAWTSFMAYATRSPVLLLV